MNKRALLALAVSVAIAAAVVLHFRGSEASAPKILSESPVEGARPQSNVTAPKPTTQHDEKALTTLLEILAAKNDNDPRLDRDFNQLTIAEKSAFQEHYRKLPAEKRNERGTIVFLLGRNLTQVEDFNFLQEVLTEPPCLSLDDCSREEKGDEVADHYHGDREITLAYPQLVAIKAVEKVLKGPLSSELTNAAQAVVGTARNSRVAAVARLAGKL